MTEFEDEDDAERPAPPEELDESIRDLLDDLASREPEQLRAVAAYAAELVELVERAETDETHANRDGSTTAQATESEPTPGDPGASPDDVPERASVSVTEIAGTEYWYYQWREGDEIRSKTVER